MIYKFKYIFLFCPLCSFGQLSEDSLRKVAKSYFEKEVIAPNITPLQLAIVENIQERCIGCFSDFKIFIVDFHFKDGFSVADGLNSYSKMYLINSYNGLKENFLKYKVFNDCINPSKVEVSNLDKCYLYLLAKLEKIIAVTPPTTYDNGTLRCSLFLSDTTSFFKFYDVLPVDSITEIKNKKYISKSTASSIYLYAGEYEQYIEKTYRYKFIFKKKNLKKVTCKVVKIKDFLK